MSKNKTCQAFGCEKSSVYFRGNGYKLYNKYCGMHIKRLQRNGSLALPKRLKRFANIMDQQ